MTDRPHPYGDCDACGDPDALMDAVETEAGRLGIDLGITASNSWDITISLGGRSLAQLLLVLRQVTHPPTQDDTIQTLLELVEGIDAVGG